MYVANADAVGPHKRLLLQGGRADFKPRCLDTYFPFLIFNFDVNIILLYLRMMVILNVCG